jgi:biopolymer transport protein ExbD/biopolymer transport protein TolR
MPRCRRRNDTLPLTADINVTSLVDVAFTLLVIFIITAPILQGGVEVKVPRAPATPISAPEGVIVTVNREGRIFIGEAEIAWEEFTTVFPDVVRANNAGTVYLRADEAVPYGRVLRVLGAMKALDVATVGLVAEPGEDIAPARGGR